MTLAGIPPDFILFALTLLGVALFFAARQQHALQPMMKDNPLIRRISARRSKRIRRARAQSSSPSSSPEAS